jgi:hypothetical protein
VGARGALGVAAGGALIDLRGPADTPGAVVLAGPPALVDGLAAHAARRGLAACVLHAAHLDAAADLLAAALELAERRGAERVGLVVHGAWTDPALRVAPGRVEVLAALDPAALSPARDPQRLSGIPLWIASGTEAAPHAEDLHRRARHPRSLLELAAVPRLEHAVNDLAAELVPVLRHGLLPGR